MLLLRITPVLLILCLVVAPLAEAKKTGYRIPTASVTESKPRQGVDSEFAAGSFMVASQCTDCNNGYRLDQISFSGFDKPATSRHESFFITNNTDRVMTGVSLYIEYITPEGRMLTKKFMKLSCHIPAGETRAVQISTWDTNSSFHYVGSRSRKGSNPFTVIFDPIAFYLQF